MKKDALFWNIAEKVLNDILQKLPGLCSDQYVGQIDNLKQQEEADKKNGKKKSDFLLRKNVFNAESVDFTEDFSTIIKDTAKSSFMILILESPHKEEFNGKIGPAKGPTGRNIQKHIAEIFGKEYEGYHLILINAIPFQCSLGIEPPGSIRDAVFTKAWKYDEIGRTFFEDRLKALLKGLAGKSVVIVNACTKDKDDKKNKGRKSSVTDSLKTIKKELPDNVKITTMWETPHPSSWWNKKNRFCVEIKD